MAPKAPNLSRGLGPRRPWKINDMSSVWQQHEAVVKNDPNDLEAHFFAGLALQMAGREECDEEYIKFCKKAEAYHVSIADAIKYYQTLKAGIESATAAQDSGLTQEQQDDLDNVSGRVLLLTRYGEMLDSERRGSIADWLRRPTLTLKVTTQQAPEVGDIAVKGEAERKTKEAAKLRCAVM